MVTNSRRSDWRLPAAVLSLALYLGCGGSDKGQVSGQVVFNGQPVTGGSITFVPGTSAGGGRVATGAVRADGAFTLTTDKDGDGALLGPCEVVYAPPSPPTETPDPLAARSPFEGLVPRAAQVEVRPGQNEFTVELVRKP